MKPSCVLGTEKRKTTTKMRSLASERCPTPCYANRILWTCRCFVVRVGLLL
jgi:hypothetical protein